MEWPMAEVFKIINLYQQFPCLWDYQSSTYKRVDKKKNAWEEIARSMGKSEEAVKKKMKHLRSAFLVEKKKIENSKKSGSATDDIYVPHLYYYKDLSFLEPVISLRPTTSNFNLTEETEIIQFSPSIESIDFSLDDSQEIDSPLQSDTPVSSKRILTTRKRKADRDHKINVALDAIIQSNTEGSETETMFSHFAKSVGMQLEKMALSVAMEAMAEIQNILSAKLQQRNCIEVAMLDAKVI